MHLAMIRGKCCFLLLFTTLGFTSVSLGATITSTTAPVIVEVELEENSGSAGRGDKVAEAASGIYEQLVQVNKLTQRCPSNLSVTLGHEKDEEYSMQLPGGLVDVNGDCNPVDTFTPQNMPMSNFGRALSTLAVMLSKSNIMDHSTHLTGQLPDGALRCSIQSPLSAIVPSIGEGSEKAFGRVSITSLKEPIVLLLRMALERVGVPSDSLDSVLSNREKLEEEWVSDRQVSEASQGKQDLNSNSWRVGAAMRPLDTSFALLLGPDNGDGNGYGNSNNGKMLGMLKDACFYIGGKRSLKSVMEKITDLLDALLPLARRARFARFGLPTPDFFALRKPCMLTAAINQVTLEDIKDFNRSDGEIGQMFAVKLNGGTDACAQVNISRFIQVEKNALETPASISKLVDEMIAMFDRYGAGSSLLRSLLADEQVAGYFPGILQTVAEFEFKTNILVGKVDLANCTVESKATLVLINRPSTMIECGYGLTNISCISQKNNNNNNVNNVITDDITAPTSGPTSDSNINIANRNGIDGAAQSVREIFDESSLILVPDNKADACVFSTLRSAA